MYVPCLTVALVLAGSVNALAATGSRPVPHGFRRVFPQVELNRRSHAVRVPARVVLRDGPLELLICRAGTKEHESILATDVPPRLLAMALIMAGAVQGTPCRFDPFRPPTGTPVSIRLAYRRAGRPVHASARTWVRYMGTHKRLDRDWVFVGSRWQTIPDTGERRFLADDGDLVTLANFFAPLLDLPLHSTASDAALLFEANTDAIPPVGTLVAITFLVKAPTTPTTQRLRPSPSMQPKPAATRPTRAP